jgi:hypothetical protein
MNKARSILAFAWRSPSRRRWPGAQSGVAEIAFWHFGGRRCVASRSGA